MRGDAMAMRFHWSMSSAGEKLRGAKARAAVGIPSLETLLRFCKHAEDCEIESLLTAFGFHRPDPLVLASALGVLTSRIQLIVQQINSIATVTGGRICINIVAGHTPEEQRYYGDFLAHDERYARTDEFLTICRALWKGGAEVDFEGRYYRIEKAKLNVGFT